MLLFDENISFRVLKAVLGIFPGSADVAGLSLKKGVDDLQIWEYAKAHSHTIVTYDEDFNELSLQKGYPPKIIWIRTANLSNKELSSLLRDKKEIIVKFINDGDTGCLELYFENGN